MIRVGDSGATFAGLSIYINLLIEFVSSVFDFRRVSFFNKIK